MIGGALAGFGWWMLRRHTEVPPLTETIDQPRANSAPDDDDRCGAASAASSARAHHSAARVRPANSPPRLGDLGTSRWALTPRDREILLACAAGAGLAAVYSVPVGGALFAPPSS